jgi:hypothetical protein
MPYPKAWDSGGGVLIVDQNKGGVLSMSFFFFPVPIHRRRWETWGTASRKGGGKALLRRKVGGKGRNHFLRLIYSLLLLRD